jgi:hypothetical protein
MVVEGVACGGLSDDFRESAQSGAAKLCHKSRACKIQMNSGMRLLVSISDELHVVLGNRNVLLAKLFTH